MNELTEQEQGDVDMELWRAEREWRAALPNHSEVEWLRIFPEALKRWKPVIRAHMILARMFLEARLSDREFEAKTALLFNHYPWRDELIKDAARRDIAYIQKQIRSIDGRLAFLRTLGVKSVDGVRARKVIITDDMIARAKEYPLGELVEINKRGFTKCIWHTDTHPSAYCKKNYIWCFVCNKGWDTIAVVMERDGLSFRDAVVRLQH